MCFDFNKRMEYDVVLCSLFIYIYKQCRLSFYILTCIRLDKMNILVSINSHQVTVLELDSNI